MEEIRLVNCHPLPSEPCIHIRSSVTTVFPPPLPTFNLKKHRQELCSPVGRMRLLQEPPALQRFFRPVGILHAKITYGMSQTS